MNQITIQQEVIEYRRKKVYQLKVQGYSNQQIADKIGVCLSTIEKDLKVIRKHLKNCFIEEPPWQEIRELKENVETDHKLIVKLNSKIDEMERRIII